MGAAVRPAQRAALGAQNVGEGQLADALVILGIIGDLAKVMTFRSLYRLERFAAGLAS